MGGILRKSAFKQLPKHSNFFTFDFQYLPLEDDIFRLMPRIQESRKYSSKGK